MKGATSIRELYDDSETADLPEYLITIRHDDFRIDGLNVSFLFAVWNPNREPAVSVADANALDIALHRNIGERPPFIETGFDVNGMYRLLTRISKGRFLGIGYNMWCKE